MSSKFILVATLAVAATLAWQSASAQASAPVSREERKAETAKMNEAGQLTKTGGGEAPKSKSTGTASNKTRAQRQAEVEEARQKGELAPAGQGGPTK